ncbi:Bromodomain-containing protein [Gymnopus androsaceus JB14]|uniref:Bromodomain-containing protein n=1 Tax=Gymnopus androsaceus JB14 TaxID=1447944 RepID=A0A6A4HLA2_9AGAR|nr:Bromodomain-containing protein [Gymnopus androsaceus JB14]
MDEEEEEENVEDVKEKGMKLWQTVKDAVKDDRPLAINFLKRPNPRVWSDYYQIISSPIALEDIKRKIKAGEYANLESVRQDLELCFNNAKTYNQPESLIYSDAKDLLKLTNKTYRKLMPSEHGTGGKPPSMKRLLNSRVQKLIKKTDDYGRILSTEFMELPSKKLWPGYYQQIQQPRCIDAIQKQVKRKEYHSVSEFAADMELVFSNAMQFNVEHTQIWEDALALRDYFRQIMADLPPPHSLPQYAQPSINKIKIKVPAAHPAAPAPAPKAEEPATLPTLSLRTSNTSQVGTSRG